jgi:hypothetical protein
MTPLVHHPFLPARLRYPGLVLVAGISVLQAHTVTILPRQAVLGPGETCQFQARLDPVPGDHPPAFIWTLVGQEHQPIPVGAGTVSATGLYRAPGGEPGRPVTILVRAQVAGDPARFDTAKVILVPAGSGAWAMTAAPAAQAGAGAVSPGVTLETVKTLPQIAHLKPRPGMEIPNPPFSLHGLDERRKPTPAVAGQWRTLLGLEIDPALKKEWLADLTHPVPGCLPGHRFAIFHGIGMSSQRRLLKSYYENADDLGSEDVFALSPWVVLGLRNAISATLIDVTRPRTWYPIGFILEVPLECIIDANPADAYLPMEAFPYDQKAFRQRFLHENPLSPAQEAAFNEFFQNYLAAHPRPRLEELERLHKTFEAQTGIIATQAYGPKEPIRPPADLVGVPPYNPERYGFNEVGFFSRTTDPVRSVRITAMVITSSGTYPTGASAPDAKPDGFYETLARAMAERLHLPLYDLRRVHPQAAAVP